MKVKRLLLFDGNALIHRAYHAMPPLTVKKTGENVGAVYGFMSMFMKTVAAYLPDYVAFAFDKKGPTFRKELYGAYKSNRPKASDDLISQIIKAHQVVAQSGIAFYEADGFEADDMIGTIAATAQKQHIHTLIVTGDADAMQLVNDQTAVLYPTKGNSFAELKEFKAQDVKDKYGVYPRHIADLKALAGDSSDNIPGIVGIGPKTAASLIEQFGSVENISHNMEQIESKRVHQLLISAGTNLALYKKLCLIRTDSPININFADMRTECMKNKVLEQIFQELDFHSLIPRLRTLTQLYQSDSLQRVGITQNNNHEYKLIQNSAQLVLLATAARQVPFFALDVVATEPSSLNARMIGFSLALSQHQVNYIHMSTTPLINSQISMFDTVAENIMDTEFLRQTLNPVLADGCIYAHNAKSAWHFLRQNGFSLPDCHFDSLLAAYVLGEPNINLQGLALKYLRQDIIPIDEMLSKGTQVRSLAELDTNTVANYSCAAADSIYLLKEVLASEIEQENLSRLYYDIELPLLPILFEMEETGILLDSGLLTAIGHKYDGELYRLTQEIYALVGHSFNISSPQQIAAVLFDELKLPVTKHTATGRSTDAGVLEEISSTHMVVPLILQYRALAKIKSTYIDALPKLVSPQDGRLHTTFNQATTQTGRLSSSDPNLQNIPVREEDGIHEIRNAFIAKNGCLLLSADYSQIDLRVLAHLSEDHALIQAFMNKEDIHTATASRLFEVSLDQVSREQRRLAKTVNFGVIYGMSGFGLERATKLSRAEANRFIKTYFEKYPAVSAYFAQVKEEARQKGFVQTLFGRRRYIADINSQNYNIRETAERMAINMPVQGTSADIIKIAMINIFKALKEGGYQSRLLLQVHDELILECPQDEIESVTLLVKKFMSEAAILKVPLVVEAKVGANWGEMQHV